MISAISRASLAAVLLIGFFVGQDTISAAASSEDSLEGTNWQLVQLTVLGGFQFVPDDHGKYVLNFRSGNRLTGTSDCNSINGTWIQEAGQLKFDPFVTTRALCAPGSLHNNLVLYLKDVDTLTRRDGHIVLTTPTQGVEIEFESRD